MAIFGPYIQKMILIGDIGISRSLVSQDGNKFLAMLGSQKRTGKSRGNSSVLKIQTATNRLGSQFQIALVHLLPSQHFLRYLVLVHFLDG
jgi:hypothetical protein